jgi:hypothetical protein
MLDRRMEGISDKTSICYILASLSAQQFPNYRKNVPRPRVSAGRGVRRDPLGEARDWKLRRNGGSTPSRLRAGVFEDLQIANRVGK